MNWMKSPEALVKTFDEALPDDSRVQRRKMFGYPAAFVNGNMFAGLHQADILLRLDEARRTELASGHGARPFEPMPGRAMKEYVLAPPAFHEDIELLSHWLQAALDYVAALPTKEPRRRKPGTKRA